MANDIDIFSGLHGRSSTTQDEEVMGYDDILGAVQEILGATTASTAGIQGSPAFAQALARRVAARAPMTKRVQPTKKRRWPIAFGPTAVPPSTTITATANPQVLYRGEKLINTGDTSNLFISSLFVGNQQQLPSLGNPISVTSFAPGVLDNEMLFDTCQPALSITVQVQNLGTTTQTWAMTLFGHIVQ
jgi:hypothetical protein